MWEKEEKEKKLKIDMTKVIKYEYISGTVCSGNEKKRYKYDAFFSCLFGAHCNKIIIKKTTKRDQNERNYINRNII